MNRTIVLAEWRRAVESLHAAELLAAEGFDADAIARAYCAALHPANAALAARIRGDLDREPFSEATLRP